MWTSYNLVVSFLSLCGAVLIFLTVLGPSPPLSHDVFYKPAPPKPKFILGDNAYASFDDAADILWGGILPRTGGSVLATNLTDGFHFWGQVSMFHQIRCLVDIRSQFLRMLRSAKESQSFVANKSSGSRYEQLGYCFDYILQVRSSLSVPLLVE
ncbi:hypothetical protein BM1_11000 [Bipolaris maydis]|nr:hypothetical protein BM1_11000 [Bipolaris maydis]